MDKAGPSADATEKEQEQAGDDGDPTSDADFDPEMETDQGDSEDEALKTPNATEEPAIEDLLTITKTEIGNNSGRESDQDVDLSDAEDVDENEDDDEDPENDTAENEQDSMARLKALSKMEPPETVPEEGILCNIASTGQLVSIESAEETATTLSLQPQQTSANNATGNTVKHESLDIADPMDFIDALTWIDGSTAASSVKKEGK